MDIFRPSSTRYMKIVQIAFGIISIIAAGIILVFPEIGILTVVLIISIALLLLGIERLGIGIFFTKIKRTRQINIGLGILAIIFSIISIAFPNFTIDVLILIVSFALMFIGITRILHVIKQSYIPKWLRIFSAVSGLFSIILSVLIIVIPSFGVILINVLLSFSLLINGIEMLTAGLSGGLHFSRKNLEDMR